ncbi:N-acetylmuramoyl-L-alanine amidase [Muricauda oceani]|uniref:N-acetylmuramoyl-L-alanine amidase n=1 Tax=Flagellimonas oceani TaxID=2698672 RepID=A0A6G7J0F7_9FLAO|nr:N-acetylmuramoyl-L-alanine amidase [Allomuricauda oceani]MBW8244231.1 N-acetylmuramoyl-L-alanine amidase [Allomuricauda oceani]QII44119.1 N-acetylmuramoyl-L-alanine amidase [Allomuricauda oceani]
MRVAMPILLLLCTGYPPLCFGQNLPDPPLVVIDPGHGGVDSGAIGTQGVLEKDIVLKVAQEMVRLNREIHGGALELYLTRYADTLISLSDRTGLAKALKAYAYVSIHCNQARRIGAQGIEVFVPEGGGRFTETSLQLAHAIRQNLNQHLGLKDRGVKMANFLVLQETTQLCPSVLVELGFLSNRVEEEHLKKKPSIAAIALVVLETLITYFNEGNNK